MYKFFLLFCCLPFFNLQAQSPNFQKIPLDSLGRYWATLVDNHDIQQASVIGKLLVERSRVENNRQDTLHGFILNEVGGFFIKTRQYQESLSLFEESLPIYEQKKGAESKEVLRLLINIGTSLEGVKKVKEASETFDRCLAIIKKNKGQEKSKEAGGLYDALGEFYRHQGKYLDAQQWHSKALKVNKLLGSESAEYNMSLNNLAGSYYGLGQFDEVLSLMLEVKEIREKTDGKEHPKYATTLNNIALVYTRMSRYEEALALYQEAKTIRENTTGKMTTDYAGLLTNIGNVYMSLTQYDKAIGFLQESVDIRKQLLGSTHPKYALSLSNLGGVYSRMEIYEEAEKCLLEVKNIYEKNKLTNHPDYGMLLSSLSSVFYKQDKNDEAQLLLEKGLKVMTELVGNKHHLMSEFLESYSQFYFHKKEYEMAIKMAEQAILANCVNIDSFDNKKNWGAGLEQADFYSVHALFRPFLIIIASLEELYKQAKDISKIEQSFKICQLVLHLNERLNREMSSNQDKLFLLEQNIQFVSQGIFTAGILKDEKTAQKDFYLERIFQLMEENKSLLLADAIQSEDAYQFGNLPDSLYQKEKMFTEQFDIVNRQLNQGVTLEQKRSLQSYLNDLHHESSLFKQELKKDYPSYYNARYETAKISIADIQQHLNQKTVMIEFFVTEALVYAFAIDEHGGNYYSILVSKKELHQQIQELRMALSNYSFISKHPTKAYFQYTKTAHWFYQKLLEPILKDKDVDALIIIADGELGNLPFEAFLTKEVSANVKEQNYSTLDYLVKDYKISYNYAASLWQDIQTRPQQENTTGKKGQLLAIASHYQQQTDSAFASSRTPYLIKLRKELNPLPAAISEVEALANLFQGQFLTKEKGTEKAFKAAKEDSYAVIHLAMHGILNPTYPLLSGLVFTEDGDSMGDNFLQAYEISNMKLNTDLVVLSACETGYGKFQQGEGVLSLARSFMYAGVPSMVVSLWQVNDRSTSVIMQNFYTNLADGMDKAEALQQAKLRYIEIADGLAAHPAFWSPFIQLGDSEPIELRKQQSWLLYGVGLAFCLMMGAVWYRRRKK